jgi:hypothetical protein
MKRAILALSILSLLGLSAMSAARDTSKHEGKSHKAMVLTGEVVDTGCYLGHAARGEKHAECAAKCINGGMPMALLTKAGTLYLLTLNHDNADPYNSLKTMAGKTVSVKGMVMEKGGMKGIDVAEVTAAPAAAAAETK